MSFITSYATAKMCAKNWNRQTIMYELLMVNYWYIHMNSNPSNTPIIRDIYQYRYNIIMYVYLIRKLRCSSISLLLGSRAIINHLALSMIICFLRKCSLLLAYGFIIVIDYDTISIGNRLLIIAIRMSRGCMFPFNGWMWDFCVTVQWFVHLVSV